MLLVNLADKAVYNLYLLGSVAVCDIDSFMDKDFLNQGIQHFGGQFRGAGKLLD